MKSVVKNVNGFEIIFDDRKDNINTHPYSIRWGTRYDQVFVFKNLKSAEKWAMKQ